MRRPGFILGVLMLMLVWASVALAGQDWEFSARHHALAETGNAAFNLKGLSPSLENIACLAGSPQYNILQESSLSTVNMFASEEDVDYYTRYVTVMTGLKTTYPTIQKDDEGTFAERLAIGFIPGIYVQNINESITYNGSGDHGANDEWTESTTNVQFFQRLGIAYGINDIVAVGVGFTLLPPTLVSVTHSGELTKTDDAGNETIVNPKDNYVTYTPFLFSPELGVLVRPIEMLQVGLTFEAGDMKGRRADVTHKYADGEEDVKTEAIFARSPSLGLGFAVLIPDIDKFMVAFDIDAEWRRGQASDYGYYADNQKILWSVSLEKMWEMSSIKGGLGYADEVGTDRYLPYDRFFVSFGSDIYLDEHIMMGLSWRGETGYMEAEPKGGLAFGGGLAWTFGGSF